MRIAFMWVLVGWVFAAVADEGKLAVVGPEPRKGVLDAKQAADVARTMSEAARSALEARGWSLADDPANADAVLSAKATSMEGAIVLTLSVHRGGSSTPAATVRAVGVGLVQVRDDLRLRVPKVVEQALAFGPGDPKQESRPGSLRMPGAPVSAAPPPAPSAPPEPARAPSTREPPPPATAVKVPAPAPEKPRAQPPPAKAEPEPAPPVVAEEPPPPPPKAEPRPPPPAPKPVVVTRPPPPELQAPIVVPPTPAPASRAQATAEPETSDPDLRLVREVLAEIERIRGLKRKKNLTIQVLEDPAFLDVLHAKAKKELTPQFLAAERARWIAFNLAPPAVDPATVLMSVLDEQVAGFYDPDTKALYVRKDPPPSAAAAGPDGFRLVLAHELEHALQDQNFGIVDLRRLPDDDARIAHMALYEGDAMAVMTAYGAARANKPVRPAIAQAASAMRAMDLDTLLKIAGQSPSLLSAPAVVREELAFPYSAGFGLVADAIQRGGFALVDRIFKSPPMSTHQVLHPDAYYAGEQPLLVAPPPAPHGTRAIAMGRMGELGTRLALQSCVDKDVVREYVPRWAGDAYTIAIAPDRSLSLLWATAWSGEGANEITNLVKMQEPCWHDQEGATPGASGWTISASMRMKTEGTRLAIARGVPEKSLDAAVAAAFTVRTMAARKIPPVGEVPSASRPERAKLELGRFASSRLGLEGALPEGFDADVSNEGAELVLTRKGANGAAATLTFVPEVMAPDMLESFFQTAAAQLASAQGNGMRLSFAGRAKKTFAGADGEERSWNVEGEDVHVRIAVAPWCNGRAAVAMMRMERGDGGGALDKFAGALKRSGEGRACADLQ